MIGEITDDRGEKRLVARVPVVYYMQDVTLIYRSVSSVSSGEYCD